MIMGFKLRKEQKWLSFSFLGFAILLLILKGVDSPSTLLLIIILILIGSFKEDIYVEPEGIIFKSSILYVIPLKTIYLYSQATKISFERLNNGFTVFKYLKGNKLKRLRIKDQDVHQVKEWIKKFNQ